AAPKGVRSGTSRNASNSLRPQNSGTEDAGPVSPPGAMSTPATSASALRRSVIPRSRSSSPLMTVMFAGTPPLSSGTRVAVTWTYSSYLGGVDEDDEVWAETMAGTEASRGQTAKRSRVGGLIEAGE